MLFHLSNVQIVLIGLASQFACAAGVWFAGRWGALFAYLLCVPFFWIVSFGLASGHIAIGLDGIVFFPVVYLGCICYSAYRQHQRETEASEFGEASSPGRQ